jgi:hypothetical protein
MTYQLGMPRSTLKTEADADTVAPTVARPGDSSSRPSGGDNDVPQQAQDPQVLRGLPVNEGFHFYSAVDLPVGVSAFSLHDFLEKLSTVPMASLEFHLYRGDFERWVTMLGDERLASQLHELTERNYTGEKLRPRIVDIVRRRYEALTQPTIQ